MNLRFSTLFLSLPVAFSAPLCWLSDDIEGCGISQDRKRFNLEWETALKNAEIASNNRLSQTQLWKADVNQLQNKNYVGLLEEQNKNRLIAENAKSKAALNLNNEQKKHFEGLVETHQNVRTNFIDEGVKSTAALADLEATMQ